MFLGLFHVFLIILLLFRSIGRKISLLVDNDDEIDIGDLPAEEESTPPRHQVHYRNI